MHPLVAVPGLQLALGDRYGLLLVPSGRNIIGAGEFLELPAVGLGPPMNMAMQS
jgi:hypothetical protein